MCYLVHRLCTVHTQSLCSCFLSGLARGMGGSRNRGLDDTDFDMGTGTQIQTQEKHKRERNLPKHKHKSQPASAALTISRSCPPLYIAQSLRCAALCSCTLCSTAQTLQRLHQVHQEAASCIRALNSKNDSDRFWNNFKHEMTSKIVSTCRMIFKRWLQHFSAINIVPNLKYGILTIKEDGHSQDIHNCMVLLKLSHNVVKDEVC